MCQSKDQVVQLPDIKDIRACIPPHCFERSLVKSFSLLVRDTIYAALVGYAAYCFLPVYDQSVMSVLGWIIYTFVQGTVVTGIWVLGHECGHQAFSDYGIINDTMGLILHTMLLVPYFSWKATHAKHHARVNHNLDGESHVANTRSGVEKSYRKVIEFIGEEGFAIVQLAVHLIFGWPAYLMFNSTGSRRRADGKRYTTTPNHFNPYSELFPEKLRFKVFISSLSLVAWCCALFAAGTTIGFRTVGLFYFAPYLVVNGYLVLITWLQHTHLEVPQFGEDEWSWLKGALSTVDRKYWAPVDYLQHYIGSTHVAHHLFPSLPCYHAREATKHLKEFLGPLYRYDSTPITVAMFQTARDCQFIDSVKGEQYFKKVKFVN